MQAEQTAFSAAWLSFDLGKYRPCDSTYCYYELNNTPTIDPKLLKGTFDWLPELSAEFKALMKKYQQNDEKTVNDALQNILAQAQTMNLTLPSEFVKFMSLEELQDQIPSCTACYFDLSPEITPCPLSNDEGYLIRFLNDQQNVLLWYLYLRFSGEHCVVVSPIPFDNAEARQDLNDQIILSNTFFCANSFEEFVYRFWLENEIWFALDEDSEMTPAQNQYLQFYQKNE
ncbi:MAG: hypothetical protein MUE85_01985 [Microscillaceae bacterium]|jgi:hypothetical protein|nr:hypothetical protein [Microscillaceae bacterium]